MCGSLELRDQGNIWACAYLTVFKKSASTSVASPSTMSSKSTVWTTATATSGLARCDLYIGEHQDTIDHYTWSFFPQSLYVHLFLMTELEQTKCHSRDNYTRCARFQNRRHILARVARTRESNATFPRLSMSSPEMDTMISKSSRLFHATKKQRHRTQ